MQQIRSNDIHGGWNISYVTGDALHGAIKLALCMEFDCGMSDVELSKVNLLPHVPNTFAWRAGIKSHHFTDEVRYFIGTARIDFLVQQDTSGDEFVATFIHVHYGKSLKF